MLPEIWLPNLDGYPHDVVVGLYQTLQEKRDSKHNLDSKNY